MSSKRTYPAPNSTNAEIALKMSNDIIALAQRAYNASGNHKVAVIMAVSAAMARLCLIMDVDVDWACDMATGLVNDDEGPLPRPHSRKEGKLK